MCNCSVIHGITKKTTFIGGMELVSLRCNRDLTSASSYGLGWYKYAIATQWYQFRTTDAGWFSLNIGGLTRIYFVYVHNNVHVTGTQYKNCGRAICSISKGTAETLDNSSQLHAMINFKLAKLLIRNGLELRHYCWNNITSLNVCECGLIITPHGTICHAQN